MFPDPRYRLVQHQLKTGPVRAIYLFAKELPGMKRTDYATWLALDGYAWGSVPTAHSPGEARRGGSFSDFTIHFADERSFPGLARLHAAGLNLDEVLVDHVGKRRRILRIVLKIAFVTSVVVRKDSFTVTFRFKTVMYEYN